MKNKGTVHASNLKVGDIVRAMKGTCTGIDFSGSPILYGPEDFRQGYDVMTVYKRTETSVSFIRPYIHLNPDGTISTIGIERVDNIQFHSGHWYELL